MIGILCEKPSAARNFAKALGGMSGTYNGEQYVIAAAWGHLYELKKPSEQVSPELEQKYKSWNTANLPWNDRDFAWEREMKAGAADMLKTIKSTFAKCSEISISCDVDPSGEGYLLGAEVLQELGLRPKVLSRMYFDDEAPASIQKAFITRKRIAQLDENAEYKKAWYRSRWDFLSMQWTRIATACGDGQAVLRQGRLKSAMVLLVGDALKALNAYKKIPYYQNRFRDENGVVYINPEEPTFPDKKQVPQSYTPSAVVLDSKEIKASAPPKYMDLAALASQLAEKGYKAQDVLAVYQKCYEAQILSYPRTEDKTITPEQFQELLPLIDQIAAVVGVGPGILTHRAPRKTHVKTGGAHGANRPGPNVPKSLDDLKRYGACAPAIYEILARNYLATLAEDYEYEAQKGHLEKYPAFTGTVSVPKKPGWKTIFNDADFDAGDTNDKGLGTMAEPFVHEGFPPKPPRPTMRWLMKQLEKRDVGTGATRTSIFAEVTSEKAKYPLLKENKGKITMTQYGDMSYRLLPGTYIGDLKITEQVQTQMRDVADGKAEPETLLAGIQQMIREDIQTMKANGETMRKELGITMARKDGAAKEKAQGVWEGENISFNRVWSGHRFTDEEVAALLASEYISFSAVSQKTGKKYTVTGTLHRQEYNGRHFIGFSAGDIQFEDDGICKCPKCGKPVIEWPENFACKTPKCLYIQKKNRFLAAIGCKKKNFSAKDIKVLCEGKSVALSGCVSKKTGKTYDAALTLDCSGERPGFHMEFANKR